MLPDRNPRRLQQSRGSEVKTQAIWRRTLPYGGISRLGATLNENIIELEHWET